METAETKTCTKCKECLPVSAFYKKGGSDSGLRPRCIQCMSKEAAVYRAANKEKVSAINAAWRSANRDRLLAKAAVYRAQNGEKAAAYRAANKERIKLKDKAYHQANKDRIAAQHAAYYQANKERALARQSVIRTDAYRKSRAKFLVEGAISRARRRGLPCDLTAADAIALQARIDTGFCEVSGIPFSKEVGKYNTPSLDRIVASEGYTLRNIRVVCRAVNMGMGQWGEDALWSIFQHWAAKKRREKREAKKAQAAAQQAEVALAA